MRPNIRFHFLMLFVGLFVLTACGGKFGQTYSGQMEITIEEEAESGVFSFPELVTGQGQTATARVVIQNLGGEDLVLSVLRLEPGICEAMGCADDLGCADGFVCDNGECVGWDCESSSECKAGSYCDGLRCFQTCVQSNDCSNGADDSISYTCKGNEDIQVKWSAGTYDLPFTLPANSTFETVEFQMSYEPGALPDLRTPQFLRIESNDPDKRVHLIAFTPPREAAAVQVFPPSYTYLNGTPAQPESQVFEIVNDGSQDLVFYDVDLKNPNPEFTITDKPAPSSVIQPQISNPGAKLTFEVRYQPIDDQGPDNVIIQVHTNDPVHPITNVELKSNVKEGKLVLSYEDMAKGYVDFTDIVGAGDASSKIINLYNEGPGSVRLEEGAVEPDDAYGAYYLEVQRPGEDPKPFDSFYAIQPQNSMNVIVHYAAPTSGEGLTIFTAEGFDRDLVISYENPYQSEITVPLRGGITKPLIQVYPSQGGVAASYVQFHSEGEKKERTMIIANEGLDTLRVTDVRLVEPPGFAGIPINFELDGVASGVGFDVPPLTLLPFTVRFKAEGEAIISHTNLEIEYDDVYPPAGDTSVWNVALRGYNQPNAGIVLPTAIIAPIDEAPVGTEIQLSGLGSLSGDAHITASGYTWYIIDKPADSAAKLNVTTGSTASFIPDKAGSYTIVLGVQTNQVTTGENTKYGEVDYVNLWSDETISSVDISP